MWCHIIESHSTSYIRYFERLTFHCIFHISVFHYTGCLCFEVKDEEDFLLEKTVRWYKTGRGKRQSKWLWNLWEWRMTPTGKNNRFPFLDILGYLKNTYKNPKFGRLRQVPTRDLGWEFPGWDLSPKLWDFYGYSLNTLKYPLLEICYFFLCPVPDNFMHQTGSLTTYNYVKTYMYTATKHLIKRHSLIFYKPQENWK